jgi:integrase
MNIEKWKNKFKIDLEQETNSESTLNNYTRCVHLFLTRFKDYKEPKEIPTIEIKKYLLKYKTLNTRKQNLCALRKFYRKTVKMPKKITKIPYPKKVRKLPRIIDSDFVNETINNIPNLKHKTIIAIAFECALRRSEVINLKLKNIFRSRNLLLIENAKGNKDRYVKISDDLLELLGTYYREYKPEEYIFNGKSKNHLKYSSSSYNNIVKKHFGEEYSTHTLRHSGTTAMHENGVDIATLAHLLGHNSVKTTEIYTHVSSKTIQKIESPLRLKTA